MEGKLIFLKKTSQPIQVSLKLSDVLKEATKNMGFVVRIIGVLVYMPPFGGQIPQRLSNMYL